MSADVVLRSMGLTQDDEQSCYDENAASLRTHCLLHSLENIGTQMSSSVPDAQAKAYLKMAGVDDDELIRALLIKHHVHQLDEVLAARPTSYSSPKLLFHHAKSAPNLREISPTSVPGRVRCDNGHDVFGHDGHDDHDGHAANVSTGTYSQRPVQSSVVVVDDPGPAASR